VGVTTRYGNQVTFTLLGPGDVFGELALIDPTARRTATLTALEATETVVLTQPEFDQLRGDRPEFASALVELLAERVRRLSDQLVEALYVPADTRVLRRLLTAADLYVGGEVPLTQDELAGLAGTARATVNRVLRAEARKGTLELKRRRIRVLDRAALERKAL
ncbi:MAG: Crp/Fnr family transcriptional regulator, partial [Chloroflexota bacterium]